MSILSNRPALKNLVVLACFVVCFAQVARSATPVKGAEPQDEKSVNATEPQSEKFTKKGWSIAPLPAVSYDSDLGWQLGAMIEVYNFGDGSLYPEYKHKFMAEACYFTKGSGIYHIFYDSKYLIKGLRVTASASYIPNTMMSFYGFNGYTSPYSSSIVDDNPSFYAIERNLFRTMVDIQGSILNNFRWAAGIAFQHYDTGAVDVKKYRDNPSLYKKYVSAGIINADEARGGSHIELKLGAVYDTRDNEPDPRRGLYADAVLYGSPDIINGRGYHYMKLGASFRHFVPLVKDKLTFAYRLSYQGTIAGRTPFYVQQNYNTLFLRQINSDILGGAISLRGVLYNRVVADGMAWANVEVRFRPVHFKLLKQEWYIAFNPFFDAGMAVQPYRLDDMKASADEQIYDGDHESVHMSAGIGGKLVMNNNFVLSIEYGIPFDKRDGNGGLYLNLNFIF